MKNYRILTATLALVLIAGLTSPVFAQVVEVGTPEISAPEGFSGMNSAAPEEIVYDNGSPDFRNWIYASSGFFAEDFILSEDAAITDVHFVLETVAEGHTGDVLEYAILADDANNPGAIIGMGAPVDFDIVPIDVDVFEVWFDLEEPVPLEAGTKYWLAIDMNAAWTTTDSFIGEKVHFGTPGGSWSEPFPTFDLYLNFVLTDHSKIVGGELLPIDSTALMLAGLQSSAIWLLPVLAGVASATAFLVRKKIE